MNAKINAHFLLRWMEGLRGVKFIFCGKNGVPLISLPFDGAGFDGSLDCSVELDFEVAYLREMQLVANDLIAPLWIGERVVSISRLEARIARLLSIQDASEERLHRFV